MIFAASAVAIKNGQLFNRCMAFKAANEDEAYGRAMRLWESARPVSEGYTDHSIVIIEVKLECI